MSNFNVWVEAINAVLWSNTVLYTLLFTGIVFTIWSGFSQYYALTHGFKVIRGDYDKADDPEQLPISKLFQLLYRQPLAWVILAAWPSQFHWVDLALFFGCGW